MKKTKHFGITYIRMSWDYHNLYYSDPAVDRDFGRKLYPWRNTFQADSTPASERLAHVHAERARREITPVNKTRLFVYHRSTQDLPPPSHIYIR